MTAECFYDSISEWVYQKRPQKCGGFTHVGFVPDPYVTKKKKSNRFFCHLPSAYTTTNCSSFVQRNHPLIIEKLSIMLVALNSDRFSYSCIRPSHPSLRVRHMNNCSISNWTNCWWSEDTSDLQVNKLIAISYLLTLDSIILQP